VKRLTFSLIAIFTLGCLLFGAVVCAAFAVQYFGSFGGFIGFATITLYVIVVALPVGLGLHWLARKLT
jgi:hypothetical protein